MRKFIDPSKKQPLEEDSEGNLTLRGENTASVYRSHEGCYDFAIAGEECAAERGFYDIQYAKKSVNEFLPEDLEREWFDDMAPWRKTVLLSLGELAGKDVLLLGNGDTRREFFFLQLGANVVFTDLSIEAVKHAKREFGTIGFDETLRGTAEFHAVDALKLPFPDGSFDVIYGAAFVHHLEAAELERFFLEVHRCLRPGGISRFIDQAYSPIWRLMTESVFYPLKWWSYRRVPRSPADVRADREGGFRKARLSSLGDKCGFQRLLFHREWFFHRIATRHYGLFFNYSPAAIRRAKWLFRVTRWLDQRLAKSSFIERNGIMLVWGFDK